MKSLGYREEDIKPALPAYQDFQRTSTKGQYATDPALLSLAPPKSTLKEYLAKQASK